MLEGSALPEGKVKWLETGLYKNIPLFLYKRTKDLPPTPMTMYAATENNNERQQKNDNC